MSQPVVQQVLHSFGDSFAHVQKYGTHYDPKFGHAKNGEEPDNPNTNANAYKNYVSTLFKVAAGATATPRVSSSTVTNLAEKVTKTEYGKFILYDAIGSVTKAEATSLVRSPVKDCGKFENCQSLGVGSQVNPLIKQIYSTPNLSAHKK